MKLWLSVSVLILTSFFTGAKAQYIGDRLPGGYPIVDTVELNIVKSQLAEIHKTRPTVALVLSGGGAKGIAHVGVIKYLESIGMPVDVVLGTSMGGLVGGLYSLGYDSKSLEYFVKTIDWNSALTDDIPRDYLSFAESRYREKFVLSFPFYYSNDEFLRMRKSIMTMKMGRDDKRYKDIHIGADEKGDNPSNLVKENLLGSLPSGFIFGHNVSNIFSSLTIGYQDEMLFSDLPIPFICVATDMVSGRAKIWTSGKLNTAFRSTMSIPGVYAPVKIDGMVLVDGGLRDNYPTDIAEYLKADFIIGVDLSNGFKSYNNLNNLGDIITQGINMLGRESYERNINDAEITIKPDLDRYNMMSFDRESLDSIMNKGYQAALEQKENLMALKSIIGNYGKVLHKKPATSILDQSVRLSGIELKGVSDEESKYLMSRINLDVTKPVDNNALKAAVATVYGTKSFDYVTYELQGNGNPYRLMLNCKKGPIHQFGLGLRLDTEEIVSVLLNLGWNAHKIQGHSVDFVGKIGLNPYLSLHYYYVNTDAPTFNFNVKFHHVGNSRMSWGDNSIMSADYWTLKEEMYLSNINWSRFDVKLGARNEFYKMNNIMADEIFTGSYDLLSLQNSYVSLFLDSRADTFDNWYFPKSGFTVGAKYSWVFAGLQKKISPFHIFSLDARGIMKNGRVFSVIPSANLRFILKNSNEDIPLPYMNVAGGSFAGRYMDQQIPFIGMNQIFAADNMFMVFRTDFRFEVLENNYLTLMLNAGDSFNRFEDVININRSKTYFGIGLEYAFNSIFGPIKADIHWASLYNKPGVNMRPFGVYLSMGFDF